MKERGRKVVRYTFVLLVALLVLFLCLGQMRNGNDTEKAEEAYPFSAKAWDEQITDRRYMISSLLEQHNGMKDLTKTEVLELLGTNTCTAYDTVYIIGKAKGLEEPPVMNLFFDEDDVFLGFTITDNHNIIQQYETAGWNQE